jgi:hypothetical protein
MRRALRQSEVILYQTSVVALGLLGLSGYQTVVFHLLNGIMEDRKDGYYCEYVSVSFGAVQQPVLMCQCCDVSRCEPMRADASHTLTGPAQLS